MECGGGEQRSIDFFFLKLSQVMLIKSKGALIKTQKYFTSQRGIITF
jgi:hypothetical protein